MAFKVTIGESRKVKLTMPKVRTISPEFVAEALGAEIVKTPTEVRLWERSRYWFHRQNRCDACYGDGFDMGLNGPYVCRPCRGSGKKEDVHMRRTGFRYDVKATVEMTRAEIMHALKMSAAHYDSICRQAGEPGPGAFLNAFKTRLDDGDAASLDMSFRELDILNKILELPGSDQTLKSRVVDVLKELRDEERRVCNF